VASLTGFIKTSANRNLSLAMRRLFEWHNDRFYIYIYITELGLVPRMQYTWGASGRDFVREAPSHAPLYPHHAGQIALQWRGCTNEPKRDERECWRKRWRAKLGKSMFQQCTWKACNWIGLLSAVRQRWSCWRTTLGTVKTSWAADIPVLLSYIQLKIRLHFVVSFVGLTQLFPPG
jgi:hypothetical protein